MAASISRRSDARRMGGSRRLGAVRSGSRHVKARDHIRGMHLYECAVTPHTSHSKANVITPHAVRILRSPYSVHLHIQGEPAGHMTMQAALVSGEWERGHDCRNSKSHTEAVGTGGQVLITEQRYRRRREPDRWDAHRPAPVGATRSRVWRRPAVGGRGWRAGWQARLGVRQWPLTYTCAGSARTRVTVWSKTYSTGCALLAPGAHPQGAGSLFCWRSDHCEGRRYDARSRWAVCWPAGAQGGRRAGRTAVQSFATCKLAQRVGDGRAVRPQRVTLQGGKLPQWKRPPGCRSLCHAVALPREAEIAALLSSPGDWTVMQRPAPRSCLSRRALAAARQPAARQMAGRWSRSRAGKGEGRRGARSEA